MYWLLMLMYVLGTPNHIMVYALTVQAGYQFSGLPTVQHFTHFGQNREKGAYCRPVGSVTCSAGSQGYIL